MTERARQWIDHIAVIKEVAGQRLARHGHQHRNGWGHCPICADPQTTPNRTETPCPPH